MGIIWDQVRRSANRRKIEFAIDRRRFEAIVSSECAYCAAPPRERVLKNGKAGSFDVKAHGVDRIDSKVGYVEGNVVPCCWTCNTMKASLSVEDFREHIKRLADNFGSVRWPWAV